jgi:hypothetical protein
LILLAIIHVTACDKIISTELNKMDSSKVDITIQKWVSSKNNNGLYFAKIDSRTYIVYVKNLPMESIGVTSNSLEDIKISYKTKSSQDQINALYELRTKNKAPKYVYLNNQITNIDQLY